MNMSGIFARVVALIGAVALLTLSAWLGIIAMGRRHAFAEVGHDDEDDDD